jgi:glyoxylase-like metal-dependent hydrolase (beta-lactamase superfamily II)
MAFSHPHFYGAMVEWSQAFGGAPIYIPAADRGWVQRDDPGIVTWSGARELSPGVTLVQCGGHFEGSAVLHWADSAEGQGALLVGDKHHRRARCPLRQLHAELPQSHPPPRGPDPTHRR